MENFPQLVPLVVFAPVIGLLINLAIGRAIGERGVSFVAVGAALTAFSVAFLQWLTLMSNGFEPFVVEIPLIPSWIRIPSAAIDIAWQLRVDTLSVTMMLVVSGIGSLIHIYATGYMHGDDGYPRFFVYLNLFLAFMMILITGNNFLVMFVGWEGVGLCSYLLIGFWYTRKNRLADPAEQARYGSEGWRNSIAGRKAMIVNRIGDFGILMAIFLIFWTFGTLDYYKPGEAPIPVHHAAETEAVAVTEESTGAEANAAEGEAAAASEGEHGDAATEGEHSGVPVIDPAVPLAAQMGVFNQAQTFFDEGGHEVDFGPVTLPFDTVVTLITIFMLLGVTGKSAQIPLFVWLPDAMAGPTPVSALIHAATMVTAGVYLVVRSNVLFANAPFSSAVVALVGTATAFVGGFIALGQWDIKKVLAYSTVSQLGFMVAAAGIGAYGAAIFHLVTHAFFKALLFLGSGSVIHSLEHGHHRAHENAHGHDGHDEHHEGHDEDEVFDPQDMRNMGGLRRTMPMTYRMYVIGALALSGIFPLAGFWSKDEILADSLLAGFIDGRIEGYIAFGLLLIAAAFTAFYMWRQVVMVFHGEPRTEAAIYTSEEDYGFKAMTRVLIALGIGSALIGFINIPAGFPILDGLFPAHGFSTYLAASVPYLHIGSLQWLLAIIAVVIGLAMIVAAGRLYGPRPVIYDEDEAPVKGKDPLQLQEGAQEVFAASNAKLYWDETYDRGITQPFGRAARWLANRLDWAFWHDFVHNNLIVNTFNSLTRIITHPVDLGLIDGTVNGVARLVQGFAGRLRRIQTGYVRAYALSVLIGAVLVVLLLLLPVLGDILGF